MKVAFSPAAEADLENIADFIAQDNPIRAISFIREIREHCRNLAHAPRAAPLWRELGEGIRAVPHKRYLIFYSVSDTAVRIERVLHGARDIRRFF